MKTISPLHLLFKSIGRYLKRESVLSFLLVTFLCSNVFAQNSANIIVQPSSTTATIGQSFVINVKVDFTTPPASSSVDAVEVHLTFDKTKLQVTSITKPASSILPNEAISLQPLGTINSNGQINYAAFALSSFPNTDFDFLTITFNPIGGAATSTPLTFLTAAPPNKTDAQRLGTSILGSVGNGTVNIQNCTLPTATIAGSAASTTCNGQPVGLRLSAATGVSPYTLVVNGTTYNNVTVGSTFASIPFPTYNIWPSNPTPATQNNYDGVPIEVGMKFRSTAAGFVKGIRLYIGSTSTGTVYTGKLWTAGGVLLASASFTPGASGWQQVLFTSPIAITANTTYIASYYSESGRYSNTDFYFCASGSPCVGSVTNGPLTALADGGIAGANGVYKTGAGGGFPSSSFNSANYWADVIFTQNTNSFNLTSVTDASGCTNSGALQTLNLTSVDCSTLPVSLLGLSASPSGRKVTLRWTTSTEINNVGFDVQRSNDGVNWTKIGFVTGAGNSSVSKNYSYVDDNLEPRRYYYRLNQMDIDGRSKYSVVVIATIGGRGEYTLGQNYPNPFRNETTIQYTLPQAGQVNLSLFDVSGRTVKVLVNASKEAGTHAINLNTGTLTRGIYYYRLQVGDFTDVKKLTIQ